MNLLNELKKKLGDFYIRKEVELVFKCFKCNRVKLEVNLNKRIYHCFRCGIGGTLLSLFKLLDMQSLERSAELSFEYKTEEIRPSSAVEIPGFKSFDFQFGTLNFKEDEGIESFLDSRGVSMPTAALRGWGTSADPKFIGRIIIPIWENSRIVCYVARNIHKEGPKELSPPSEVSNRSHFLYNLDSIRENEDIVLVEGIFDCEAVVRAGFDAVAVMGCHISEIQVGKLLAKSPKSISLMFDNDEAGRLGAARAFRDIGKRFCMQNIFFVRARADPDELTVDEIKECLAHLIL